MTYERATWLPQVLRRAGLEVIEHPGWRERGLGEHRPFEVEHVVWHHDASAVGDSPGVPDYMIRNFEAAGAQIWVDRAGRWHLVASGRAAHAGTTRNDVENENSLGIETDHTTGEAWPEALLASLRTGTAAILRHIGGKPGANLHFHKSICYPVGRKVDPDGLGLVRERLRVLRAMRRLSKTPRHRKDTRPAVSLSEVQRAARVAPWSRPVAKAVRPDVERVREALKAEGFRTYRAFQVSLGYTGADADGIPGDESLTVLGDRHGFRVVE